MKGATVLFTEMSPDLDWEDDLEVPGRFVKLLDDNLRHGFRAQLVKVQLKPGSDLSAWADVLAALGRHDEAYALAREALAAR